MKKSNLAKQIIFDSMMELLYEGEGISKKALAMKLQRALQLLDEEEEEMKLSNIIKERIKQLHENPDSAIPWNEIRKGESK